MYGADRDACAMAAVDRLGGVVARRRGGHVRDLVDAGGTGQLADSAGDHVRASENPGSERARRALRPLELKVAGGRADYNQPVNHETASVAYPGGTETAVRSKRVNNELDSSGAVSGSDPETVKKQERRRTR